MALKDIMNSFRELRISGRHRSPEDHTSKDDTTCLNCGTVFKGNFCPTCGQSGDTKKLTIGMAFENFVGVMTNFDRGLAHTLTELIYRPGHMIRDYLEGHRVEYLRPIQLLFLLITVILSLMYFLSIEVEAIVPLNIHLDNVGKEKMQPIFDAVNAVLANLSFMMIALSIVNTLPNYFSFRLAKYGKTLTLAENFYVMAYISCLLLLWRIPFLLVDKFVLDIEGTELIMDQILTLLTYKQLLRVSLPKALGIYLLSATLIVAVVAMMALIIYLLSENNFVIIRNISLEIE